jgi:chaperone required for assembly of F1-ATPase
MKRFYRQVSVENVEGGWRVLLDGRPVRTAGRRAQLLPTQALAEAMAAEWAAQGETIDPSGFILRDLADYAIDVVSADRGEQGEPLLARQVEIWEPLLTAAEQRWDVHFERIGGIIHRPQPPATLARMEAALAAEDAFSLAALQTLASLAASLVIALAAITPGADGEALWRAANLEEDWQAEFWGKDAEAEARRAARYAAFTAAMRFAELARS